MSKKILITGSTDGIGLATAEMLVSENYNVIVHGRSQEKLQGAIAKLQALGGEGSIDGMIADLSDLNQVATFAESLIQSGQSLDVLINNAGIFKTPSPFTSAGFDVRFVVNTLAPYLLTRRLMPVIGNNGRVVNLSSAAQSPVNLRALAGQERVSEDFAAYAQSKLALTMWSRQMGLARNENEPMIVSVNPGSLLASKMVKEGFGVAGGDIRIGADILVRAALSDEFESASGQYFDNDAGSFSSPQGDALDDAKCAEVIKTMDDVLAKLVLIS